MFKKNIYLLVILLLLLLSSCTGAGTATTSIAPSGGTTVGTGTGSIAVLSSPTSIPTYGSASVTATVTDAAGSLAADGTSVSFSLDDSTLGTLSSSTATTTNGTARITLTAKNNTGSLKVTAASGSLTGSVILTITASTTSAVSLMASPSSISVSGTSTITARVVDSSGNSVVDGTSVSFSLDNPFYGSLSSSTAVTSSGSAAVTFTASATASGTVTITATSGTASGTIAVTITGGLTGGSITVSASPSSIATSGTSTITATVKDSSNNPVSGAAVSFSINSTAATLSGTSATTDSSGAATVTLTAGTTEASVSITATSSTLSGSTTVTITTAAAEGTITVSASSASITTSKTATITATVKDSSNNPVSGATINFSLSNTVATLSSSSATTDSTGVATVTLTAGNTPTSVTITAASSTLSGSVTITIEAPLPANVSLAVNPSSITILGTSTITATVKDGSDNPVLNGTSVSFTLSSDLYGSLSSASTTTANNNGTATTTFTASSTSGTVTITAAAGNVSSTISLTITPSSTGSIEFVSATPQVIGIKGSGQTETSSIKFLVKDINGNAVTDGTSVSFSMVGTGGGEYIGEPDDTPLTAISSTVSGYATVILNSGSVAGPVTVIASTNVNSGKQATLSSNINSTVTTIGASSTSGFPSSGRIKIDNELIDYTGTTSTSFTGCTRGVASTTATSHSSNIKVYGQDTISSSATQVSIGGGVASATHFDLSTSKFNLAGLVLLDDQATVTAYIADRFGNYNILKGTSVSFYAEAGAIDRSNVTDASGITTVKFRSQSPAPAEVAITTSTYKINSLDETTNISNLNTKYSLSMPTDGSYHPRDGWVTILAVVQGEEAFNDANANGVYDIGESFDDSMGEPFIDKNDDGCRNDGTTKNCSGTTSASTDPFEEYIDVNGNGSYDGPNGVWDGPACPGTGCQTSKVIWKSVKVAFTGNAYYCAVTPTTFNISNGSSQTFSFMVGDINTNKLVAGTTISVSASKGTLGGQTSYEILDGVPSGPTEISFSLGDSDPKTATADSSTIVVTVTPLAGSGISGCSAVASGTVN